MKRTTFLLVLLMTFNLSDAQDLVITIGADHKPKVEIPASQSHVVMWITNADALSAVLVRNVSDDSRLPFGGAGLAMQEGEQRWSIVGGKVTVGAGAAAKTLTIAPTDKLTVRVSWLEGEETKHADWPGEVEDEVAEEGGSAYTRFLRPANGVVFRPSLAEVTTMVAGSAALLAASQPEQRIVIDVANRTWYAQEKTGTATTYTTRTDRLSFKPRVGTDLQFRFINYDPTKERASIETEYADLHLELQDRFAGFMDPGSIKGVDTKSPTPSSTADTSGKAAAEMQAVNVNGLRDDLQSLFYNLQDLDADDKIQDRMGLKRIKQRVAMKIQEHIGFDPDEKDAWEAKAQDMAKDAQMDQEQATALANVMLAAESYYKAIETLGAHNQLPLRIESMDELKVAVKIFEGTSTTPAQASNFSLWNKGGVKIDFSAGFMGTWLIDDAFTTVASTTPDTTFYVDPEFNVTDSILVINDVTTQHVKQTNAGEFRIGAGIMSHVYWRCGGWLNIGAAAGFMVSNDQPVNYLLGGSLLLGRKSRFAITGGCAFGQVERLATGYAEGNAITLASGAEVPTEQRWESSFFVGVGMNFASAKVLAKPASTTP